MEILIASGIGYCFGVQRAVSLAEKAAATYGAICTLGPLIHNQAALARMQNVQAVDSLAAVTGDVVLIRSHGVPPSVFDQAAQRGLTVIDGTCPFVNRAQRLACIWTNAGYQVIIVGNQSAVNLAVHAKNDAVRCTALAARMQEQRRLSWQRT